MTKGVLEGIKAISMGSAWAGPYVGRVLAEMGAEVFRISFPASISAGDSKGPAERGTRPPELIEAWKKKQLARGMSEQDLEKAAIDGPGYVGNFQPDNLGVGIDLRNEKGRELYRKLVKVTDIVLDGWSPRVMTDLGLGYQALKEIRPDIIYVSLPALGMTGPEKDVRMFGTGCEWISGLTSTRGYPGGEPHRAANFIVDGISSAHILTAIMAALNQRADTGKGQHIDISQAECATSTMADAIMDYSMNRRIARPTGNLHPTYAPHGCYRCRGDDMWVTIAVTSDEEWTSLCKVFARPEWLDDPRFADGFSRKKNEEELDRLIEEWTAQHDHYAVQEMLQAAGVAAAAVATLEEHILYDPQVQDRDIYHWLTYHDGIDDPIFRAPWVLPKTPTSLTRRAPSVGEDNNHVLGEILGMTPEEINKLTEDKVIGEGPPSTR